MVEYARISGSELSKGGECDGSVGFSKIETRSIESKLMGGRRVW